MAKQSAVSITFLLPLRSKPVINNLEFSSSNFRLEECYILVYIYMLKSLNYLSSQIYRMEENNNCFKSNTLIKMFKKIECKCKTFIPSD